MHQTRTAPMEVSTAKELQKEALSVPLIRSGLIATGSKSGTDKLALQEGGRHFLQDLAQPCALIGVGGSIRKGKSSLLNFIAEEELFRVDNRQSCTKGVDIALINPESFLLSSTVAPRGSKTQALRPLPHVCLADLEGTGEQGSAYDTSLMLSMLSVSNIFLFNLQGQHGKAVILEKLSQLAELGERLTPVSTDASLFGHLHLIFRDWQFAELSESDIEHYIIDKEVLSVSADEDEETQITMLRTVRKHNKWREQIKKAFKSVTVTLMPFPTAHTASLQKSQLGMQDLQPSFIEKVQQLKRLIAAQLAEVEPYAHGKRLALLCEKIVVQINKNDGFISMVEVNEQIAMQEARERTERCFADMEEYYKKAEPQKESSIHALVEEGLDSLLSAFEHDYVDCHSLQTIFAEATSRSKTCIKVICGQNSQKVRQHLDMIEEKMVEELTAALAKAFGDHTLHTPQSIASQKSVLLNRATEKLKHQTERFCDDARVLRNILTRLESVADRQTQKTLEINEQRVEELVNDCIDSLTAKLKRAAKQILDSEGQASATARLEQLRSSALASIEKQLAEYPKQARTARQMLERVYETVTVETSSRIERYEQEERERSMAQRVAELQQVRSSSYEQVYAAPSTPASYYSPAPTMAYTPPAPSSGDGKFYKGGQFTPGGGRAPAGGAYMTPSPSYSTPTVSRSYSSSSSTSSGGTFYKGGQFTPGGGRAPKGGGYY